jgi:sugar O-acyltransferase (sialic acid O-acetyltransferase NeuD family)
LSARRVLVLGASAFAKIAEVLEAFPNLTIDGVLDDDARLEGTSVAGVAVRGPLSAVHDAGLRDHALVFGIGSWRTRLIRREILQRLAVPRERWISLIHPRAMVSKTARIGAGAIVYVGAAVLPETVIGDFAVLSTGALIGDHNHLAEGVLAGGNATTTTGVRIGAYAHLGAGSCVAEGVQVGAGAQLGVGCVALRDVPAGAFVLGNPGRVVDRVAMPEALATGASATSQW